MLILKRFGLVNPDKNTKLREILEIVQSELLK